MRADRNLRIFETASVLLFFLQAVRVIFSTLFGIIYDQVFAGSPGPWLVISNLLVLAAFFAPAFAPRKDASRWLAVFASIAAVARLVISRPEASIRFWGAVFVLAAAGLYLATLLRVERPAILPGLMTALVLDGTIRLLGDTYDLSLRPTWWFIQLPWSAYLINVAVRQYRASPSTLPAGFPGWGWGLAWGGFLFLESSLLSLPNAVARWSGLPYGLVALALLVVTLIFWEPTIQFKLIAALSQGRLGSLLSAALLPVCLLVGYFLPGYLSALALILAHALALLLALKLFAAAPGTPGRPGLVLAFGMIVFVLLNYFNAFAFTYPYALPFMRDLGWLVYLAAALSAGVGLLAAWALRVLPEAIPVAPILRVLAAFVILALSATSLLPKSVRPLPDGSETLGIATYNIHYGYEENWRFTLEEIARTIEEEGVDIAMLQEVDAGRLTSYAVDDAYYLARRLRMNVSFLPTVEHLTGIAVLYKGQAQELESQLLPSLQEQTGIIRVTLDYADRPLHAFGIWMGLSNEDTQRQIEEALRFIGDRSPAAFGGDFNAKPDSPVAKTVREAGFLDPFLVLGIDPPPPTSPAINPNKQIDYVWLRGLEPAAARVSESLTSDHRMVVVEILGSGR